MPKRLGGSALDEPQLKKDIKAARRFGPCAVGEKALYLSSFFLERRYYLPMASVRRIYKRVAMSSGGFTGKGLFATIPYLVVEFDGGRSVQCNFKREEDVDAMLAEVVRRYPHLPTHSEAAERRLAQKAAEEAARPRPQLTEKAAAALLYVDNSIKYLERYPVETTELGAAARAKRVNERSNPAYKWVALAIVLGGAAALAYGVWTFVNRDTSGLYYFLFGLAAILLFSSANVLPTARNNKKAVEERLRSAQQEMEKIAAESPEPLPVPARYAHPAVLERMAEVIRQGRAESCEAALAAVKNDLRQLNSDVQVEQEEYEQVVQIKPMFLVEDYR